MKAPKLKGMKVDKKGTAKIRSRMAAADKIKITINIDSDSLAELRKMAKNSGVPYQRLLNQLVKESLEKHKNTESALESRISQLEKELKKIKRKVA